MLCRAGEGFSIAGLESDMGWLGFVATFGGGRAGARTARVVDVREMP